MTSQDSYIQSVIAHFGSQVALADALGIKQGTVSGWLNRDHRMSAVNAMKIERLTDSKFKAELLSEEYKKEFAA